ncbi:hypothetical protein K432DRAFT_448994 [Lepidopterella palustris CBS 459.81]|uniref:Rhodopsin domain-containing protein n=1 Tax=Lepidopterella palustris CBS 459.81 TaxID=1314670 RepID=A0A8E2DX87_9PEZI|nr:hypothetical protein K432DRAFT_448994 [Lepidopterella palustris CBS 459.81]
MLDTRSQMELGVTLTLFGLACIALLLRIYVRVKMLRIFGVDDWLMAIAMIEFLSGLFYALTTPCLKASIGTLLLRFVRKKVYIYIVWLGIALSLGGSLWTFFELILFCSPPRHFWDPSVTGTCKAPNVLSRATLGQNTINFITDLVFGLLPALVVYELQMNRNTKVSLAVILLLGNLAMVATAVRFKFVASLPLSNPDFLYMIVDARILSTVEIGLGTIMASLVTLRPLFRALLHLGSSNKSRTDSGRKHHGYENQLHSLDDPYRANDGDVPLYPLSTTRVVAGKLDHRGASSRSSEWERTDDESSEGRGGGIKRDITYTIEHNNIDKV